jgi:hypothetical protein
VILALQGTPGSGKSSVAVADMAEFLLDGGVVATNFSLTPDWLDLICSASYKYSRMSSDNRDAYRRSMYSRAFKIGTPRSVMELGPRLKELFKGKKMREGLGRLYLDESQLLFNSRDWEKNKGFIEFFTQHRKLRWDVYLVTHTLDMIDKQIRGLVEYETRLRNLQNVKLLGMIPLAWKPAFVAITRYAGISAGAGEIYNRRLYTLNPIFKNLYDTCEVFAFDVAADTVSHHGEYTPPSPHKTFFDRLWVKLFLEQSIQEAKRKLVCPASAYPPYHSVVRPSAPSAPRAMEAAPSSSVWSSW